MARQARQQGHDAAHSGGDARRSGERGGAGESRRGQRPGACRGAYAPRPGDDVPARALRYFEATLTTPSRRSRAGLRVRRRNFEPKMEQRYVAGWESSVRPATPMYCFSQPWWSAAESTCSWFADKKNLCSHSCAGKKEPELHCSVCYHTANIREHEGLRHGPSVVSIHEPYQPSSNVVPRVSHGVIYLCLYEQAPKASADAGPGLNSWLNGEIWLFTDAAAAVISKRGFPVCHDEVFDVRARQRA